MTGRGGREVSVPVTVEFEDVDRVVFVGFGAGLTWGASVVQWSGPILPKRRIRPPFTYRLWARVRSLLLRLVRFMEGIYTPSLKKIVENYLEHEDDDVRLAALDYFFKRPEEEAREPVLKCYLDSDDRPRIRAHILDRLIDLGWSVRGFRPKIEEALPEGYFLTRDGTVKAISRRP